jgi:hypothetical protein
MSEVKLCKRCTLPNMEYYPRRNTCKECIRSYQREYNAKIANPKSETAVCGVCKIEQPTERFKISRKTLRLKDTCMDCKIPKGIRIERYLQLNEWVNRLVKESSPADIRILKHIFEKK